MQDYVVRLESPISKSFRCVKAANSLDINVEKKSVHKLEIKADLETEYNIGLIVGSSGSGKTTLCKSVFGEDCFKELLDPSQPIIDQFPKEWDYETCANALNGVGLTSVPCWVRPAYTLSNGQKSRCEAALQLANVHPDKTVLIDEWTSVVDRKVAKVMSHCVQKYARRKKAKIILASCHYDIIEWVNPDWIIDCNKQEYIDRRSMVGTFERTDRLRLDIKEVSRKSWKYFSKYHYLSDKLPGGRIYTFGLFEGKNQIGFQCYAAYIIGNHTTFFSNRVVIHPDYAGIGLGIYLINITSKIMTDRGFDIKAKFSSIPLYKSRIKSNFWKLTKIGRQIKQSKWTKETKTAKGRIEAIRNKCKTFHFDFNPIPFNKYINENKNITIY